MYGRACVCVCVCVLCVCVCVRERERERERGTYVYVCIVPNLGPCLERSRLAYPYIFIVLWGGGCMCLERSRLAHPYIDGGTTSKYTETLLLDTYMHTYMYPPPHMHVSSSSYEPRHYYLIHIYVWCACVRQHGGTPLTCILLLICMYPPPHMTCMYPPHMTCMYHPPHMTYWRACLGMFSGVCVCVCVCVCVWECVGRERE
jgi:hypothetical protein